MMELKERIEREKELNEVRRTAYRLASAVVVLASLIVISNVAWFLIFFH